MKARRPRCQPRGRRLSKRPRLFPTPPPWRAGQRPRWWPALQGGVRLA